MVQALHLKFKLHLCFSGWVYFQMWFQPTLWGFFPASWPPSHVFKSSLMCRNEAWEDFSWEQADKLLPVSSFLHIRLLLNTQKQGWEEKWSLAFSGPAQGVVCQVLSP